MDPPWESAFFASEIKRRCSSEATNVPTSITQCPHVHIVEYIQHEAIFAFSLLNKMALNPGNYNFSLEIVVAEIIIEKKSFKYSTKILLARSQSMRNKHSLRLEQLQNG